MSDNKVNMSLDDIIKNERKNKRGKGQIGKTRTVRNVARRKNIGQARKGKRNNIKLNAATVKAVNRLVKKAISQRATQQLIQRAVTRRAVATRRILAARPAGFRARRSFNFVTPLRSRLRGVNQRSRVIMSAAARRAQQQEPIILSNTVKNIRGRGTARLGQLVSDEAPVYVKREVVPIVEEELVEEVPRRFQFARRRQVVQQRRRPIVLQRRIANRPVVTYIPARNNRIAKRNRFVTRNVEPVFERVKTGKRVFVNPNAAQMREALGIGKRVERVVERFEPSSSFLQRIPAAKRKGRGFQEGY